MLIILSFHSTLQHVQRVEGFESWVHKCFTALITMPRKKTKLTDRIHSRLQRSSSLTLLSCLCLLACGRKWHPSHCTTTMLSLTPPWPYRIIHHGPTKEGYLKCYGMGRVVWTPFHDGNTQNSVQTQPGNSVEMRLHRNSASSTTAFLTYELSKLRP